MIKFNIRVYATLAAFALLVGTQAFAADVTVKVTGFRNEKGSALVYLWNGVPGFPTDTSKAMTEKNVKTFQISQDLIQSDHQRR